MFILFSSCCSQEEVWANTTCHSAFASTSETTIQYYSWNQERHWGSQEKHGYVRPYPGMKYALFTFQMWRETWSNCPDISVGWPKMLIWRSLCLIILGKICQNPTRWAQTLSYRWHYSWLTTGEMLRGDRKSTGVNTFTTEGITYFLNNRLDCSHSSSVHCLVWWILITFTVENATPVWHYLKDLNSFMQP